MRRFLPHIVWFIGLSLLAISVFVGPGVPYQDPTAEMRALEARQTRLGDGFMMVGFLIFHAGVIWAVAAWFMRWRSKRRIIKS
jgi:hypothetical protein